MTEQNKRSEAATRLTLIVTDNSYAKTAGTAAARAAVALRAGLKRTGAFLGNGK